MAVTGSSATTVSCRCSQKDNQDTFFKISSTFRLPTTSDLGADSVRVRVCVCSVRRRQQAGLHWLTCWLSQQRPPFTPRHLFPPTLPTCTSSKSQCCCYRGWKNFNNPHKLLSKCSTVEGQWSAQSSVWMFRMSCDDATVIPAHHKTIISYYSDFLEALVLNTTARFFCCCCTECCSAEVVASVLDQLATFGFLLMQSSQQQ